MRNFVKSLKDNDSTSETLFDNVKSDLKNLKHWKYTYINLKAHIIHEL